MNYVAVTDIFGNTLKKGDPENSKQPFLLLHTVQPDLLIMPVSSRSKEAFNFIYPAVMHVLYYNSIDPSSYAPVGSFFIKEGILPKKMIFILVNTDTQLSSFPTDFVEIGSVGDCTIWKPVAPIGYVGLGYYASYKKPSTTVMRTVNKAATKRYSRARIISGKSINMNEFNLLGTINTQRYTVDRTVFLKGDRFIRLSSNKGRILAKGNKTDVVFTNKGNLKIDGQCVTVKDNDNVGIQPCDSIESQKWYPYKNMFISNKNDKCLTDGESNLTVTECGDNSSQSWYVQERNTVIEDTKQDDYGTWKTQTGKRVILFEPDNPWYINRRKTEEPEGIIQQGLKVLNQVDYRDNANYRSSFMMDTNKSHMGYGHSYASRLGRRCLCLDDCDKKPSNPKDEFILEPFGEEIEDSSINRWLIILAVIIVILIFLLWWFNR